jgi:hypothetical protein
VAIAFKTIASRREHACRLTPDRALDTLDDARAFLDDRGMLTLTPDCALPSLFGACHEEPWSDAPGFGTWPKTRYWWPSAFDVLATRLHRGKVLYLSPAVAAVVDPLCREELARAEAGEHGPDAVRIVAHLAEAGPSYVEELKDEAGLEKKTRARLEKVGAIVSRGVIAETHHHHTSELCRWDQVVERADPTDDPLRELLVAGVRAAVVAPEAEALRWFTWRIPKNALDDDRLSRPEPGWVAYA